MRIEQLNHTERYGYDALGRRIDWIVTVSHATAPTSRWFWWSLQMGWRNNM
ncbi:hypothetical protein ABX014_13140 [Snodgrassella alvi]